MAAQGNLTLNTKVYAPRGKSGVVATWALVGDTTFGGATSNVTESIQSAKGKAGSTRVQMNLTVPKAASVDSACACIGAEIARGAAYIQVDVPAGFTTTERQDFCDRIQALVANAIFDSAVANLEGAW